jgi:putative ABC transport system permease protein
MSSLVVSALRARRLQTVAVFALTVLAALGGSAAPWYLQWAHDAVAASDIAAAPISQRVVTLSGLASFRASGQSPLAQIREQAGRSIQVPGSEITVGSRLFATAVATGLPSQPSAGLYLGTRDDVCAHIVLEGRCPTGADDVVIGRSTAATLGVHVGDPLTFDSVGIQSRLVLHISGVYDVQDVLSPYWTGTNLLGGPSGLLATQLEPAAFVSEPTLLAANPDNVDVDLHLVLPPTAFHDSGDELSTQLHRAADQLGPSGFGLATGAGNLIAQIRLDQRLVRDGVTVATLELVLLSWFVLYLAVRQTSVVRRSDIGLLKLRGAPRRRIWLLTGEQSAVPMLAGVAVGGAAGYLAAAALAGSTVALHPAAFVSTVETSVVVAAGVVFGALVAAVAAEWSVLRAPVLTLIRRVPTRRSGWRGTIGDLAVVVLALAGVYQSRAETNLTGEPSALALLAPGLVGLAAALLMARALPWLAARSGAGAISAGRAGAALGALHVARRPGTERVFAIVAIAVSVLSTTLMSNATARNAWQNRAQLELGAPRVLLVRAPSSTALLAAVRAADPAGRYAMAVARSLVSQTVAVDTPRLANVALLPAGYGLPDADRLAQLLRPVAPSTVALHDGPLTIDADGPDPAEVDPAGTPLPVSLRVQYADPTGGWHTAEVGPLRPGRHTYDATISGCGTGCRLVSFEPVTFRNHTTVGLHSLSQAGSTGVTGAVLADITRWRSQVGPTGIGPVIGAHDGELDITVTALSPSAGQHVDNRVFYAGTPTPVPLVLAGQAPVEHRPGDARMTLLGTEDVPYQPVATGSDLPRLGDAGAMMDLEYAQNTIGQANESVSLEVWLTADAPPAIVDKLRAGGLEVLTDTTLASITDELAARGPGVALRFQLFAAAVLLLLAAGALVVAGTVERRDRARELGALRNQGLSERAMRFAGYAASLLIVAAAVATGVVAAVIGHGTTIASLPVFTDNWTVLPTTSGVSPATVGLALGLAVLVLAPVAVSGAARLVRLARRTGAGR